MAQPRQQPPCGELNDLEANLIRLKARKLVRLGRVPRSDLEDVQQELAMALLVAHGKVRLNAETRSGFSARVVDNTAANLVRDRRCVKRGLSRACSLDDLLGRGIEPHELAETSPETTTQLRLDFDEFLMTLPDELRVVTELLKTHRTAEAAEKLGVSRSTVYNRRRNLQRRLIRAGLQKYLPTVFDTLQTNGVLTQ